MSDFVDKFNEFLNLRAFFEEKLEEFVKDKSIPLDIRWEVFERSGMGESRTYIVHFKTLPEDIVTYEGLVHCEIYQTMSVFRIVEDIEEYLEECNSGDAYDLRYKKMLDDHKFDIKEFKEECLSMFLKEYKFDW